MAQQGQSFTPAEVLRAGLQAEAEGRLDYAVQFFRHLTDHHGHSQEAAEARAGLQRIAGRRGEGQRPEAWAGPAPLQHGYPAPQPAPPQQPQPPRPAVPGPERSMARAETQRPGNGGAIVPRPNDQPPAQHAPAAAPAATPAPSTRHDAALPPAERRYMAGRVMAALMQIVGGLMAAAGLVLTVLAVVLGGGLPVPGPASSPAVGPVLIMLGCVLVFWGQVARAIFDTANAARDLAALERARMERRGRSRG